VGERYCSESRPSCRSHSPLRRDPTSPLAQPRASAFRVTNAGAVAKGSLRQAETSCPTRQRSPSLPRARRPCLSARLAKGSGRAGRPRPAGAPTLPSSAHPLLPRPLAQPRASAFRVANAGAVARGSLRQAETSCPTRQRSPSLRAPPSLPARLTKGSGRAGRPRPAGAPTLPSSAHPLLPRPLAQPRASAFRVANAGAVAKGFLRQVEWKRSGHSRRQTSCPTSGRPNGSVADIAEGKRPALPGSACRACRARASLLARPPSQGLR